MKCKILTAQIQEEIYDSLISGKLFPEEQKGYYKGSRRKDKLLYINYHTLKKSKTRRKTLAMAWIDHKKAQDIVPQKFTTKL